MLWVEPAPAGCAIDGQTMTCDVDPALMGLEPPVVIVARSGSRPTSPPTRSSTRRGSPRPTTRAARAIPTVTSPTARRRRVPTRPRTTSTARRRRSSAPAPSRSSRPIRFPMVEAVRPGDSYSYRLRVRNLGPSTILPGSCQRRPPGRADAGLGRGRRRVDVQRRRPGGLHVRPALAPNETAPDDHGDGARRHRRRRRRDPQRGDDDRHHRRRRLPGAMAQAPCIVTDDDDETTPAPIRRRPRRSSRPARRARPRRANRALAAWRSQQRTGDRRQRGHHRCGPRLDDRDRRDVVRFSCSRNGNSVSCTVASLAPVPRHGVHRHGRQHRHLQRHDHQHRSGHVRHARSRCRRTTPTMPWSGDPCQSPPTADDPAGDRAARQPAAAAHGQRPHAATPAGRTDAAVHRWHRPAAPAGAGRSAATPAEARTRRPPPSASGRRSS